MRTIIIIPMRVRALLATVALIPFLSSVSGCSSSREESGGRPTIVVTHAVLGAIVTDVVGDSAEVRVLIPNGVDPHEWEPSAKDVEAINDAALVVANGLGFEEGLIEVLAETDAPVVELGEHVTALSGAKHEHGDEHGDEHGATDPHFWTDPLAVAEAVEHLSEELGQIGLDVDEAARLYIDSLDVLDGEIVDIVSSIPADDRVLITGHVSMAYFAAHYGFEVLGSVVPSLSTAAEASAAKLVDLKEVIASRGVSVIFTEVGAPDDVVQALAEETGVRVVILDTLTVPSVTYRSYLVSLASQVRDALTS